MPTCLVLWGARFVGCPVATDHPRWSNLISVALRTENGQPRSPFAIRVTGQLGDAFHIHKLYQGSICIGAAWFNNCFHIIIRETIDGIGDKLECEPSVTFYYPASLAIPLASLHS